MAKAVQPALAAVARKAQARAALAGRERAGLLALEREVDPAADRLAPAGVGWSALEMAGRLEVKVG
jgi:hypothetical protein